MAGYLVNGCGASDSYYKLKDVGSAMCTSCRKETPWALMELKMKIRILFVPTVSIKTRYAVVCTRCKTGYYVEEEQKNHILSSPSSCVEIRPDGVIIHGMKRLAAQPEADAVPPPASPPPLPSGVSPSAASSPLSSGVSPPAFSAGEPDRKEVICGFCGAAVQKGEIYCGNCGRRIGRPGAVPVQREAMRPLTSSPGQGLSDSHDVTDFMSGLRRRKVCPVCGLMFVAEKEFCDICGGRLEERK